MDQSYGHDRRPTQARLNIILPMLIKLHYKNLYAKFKQKLVFSRDAGGSHLHPQEHFEQDERGIYF